MIVSQSFKIKQQDGSFSDETMLSTTSDLVFYKDGKTLTTKTSETDAAIAKEVTDRENAIDIIILINDLTDYNSRQNNNENKTYTKSDGTQVIERPAGDDWF